MRVSGAIGCVLGAVRKPAKSALHAFLNLKLKADAAGFAANPGSCHGRNTTSLQTSNCSEGHALSVHYLIFHP